MRTGQDGVETWTDGLRICSLSSDVSVSGILDTEHNDLYCSERIPKIKSNLAIAKGCSLFKILYESKGSGFSIKSHPPSPVYLGFTQVTMSSSSPVVLWDVYLDCI